LVQVIVNSDELRAWRILKKKALKERIQSELRNRKNFEKKSDKKRRKRKDSARRINKLRRRQDREE
jgi:ribosomal protein S21